MSRALHLLRDYFKYKFKVIVKNRVNYFYTAPFFLLFLIFTLAPVVAALALSFTHYNVLQPPTWAGLDNYYRLFMEDDLFIVAAKNTLVFAAIIGPGGYLLSLIFAWLINELPPKIRAVFTILFYTPSISAAACVTVWKYFFSNDSQGLINSYLIKWGLVTSPVQFLTNPAVMPYVVIGVILWASIGTGFLSLIAGLQNVDRAQYEAGMVDGINNRWQELWYITLPNIKSQMLFAAVMSISSAFNIGTQITLYVGFPSPDYAMHTVMHHMEDYGVTRFEMGYSLAISTILFFVMIYCNKGVQYLLRRVGK